MTKQEAVDVLKHPTQYWPDEWEAAIDIAVKVLSDSPKEIIHCKNCKYCHHYYDWANNDRYRCCAPYKLAGSAPRPLSEFVIEVSADDFCSRGEIIDMKIIQFDSKKYTSVEMRHIAETLRDIYKDEEIVLIPKDIEILEAEENLDFLYQVKDKIDRQIEYIEHQKII